MQNGWDAKAQAKAARIGNDKFIADAATRGITVYTPNAAEMAQWKAAGKRASEEMMAGMGPEAKQIHEGILRDIAGVK